MATTNPYAVGLERHFVNGVAVSPMNFLKCVAFIDTKRITVIQGSKHYTRKESGNRCRPLASALNNRCVGKGNAVAVLRPTAAVFDCQFGMPSIFLSTTKHQEHPLNSSRTGGC